ncbi:nucleotidyltransferase domain-containing protein [Stygiolobus caldivivus]|nr:nucleotidyltransferase domain-containing protein [Stygiolobus caldivivus]
MHKISQPKLDPRVVILFGTYAKGDHRDVCDIAS